MYHNVFERLSLTQKSCLLNQSHHLADFFFLLFLKVLLSASCVPMANVYLK